MLHLKVNTVNVIRGGYNSSTLHRSFLLLLKIRFIDLFYLCGHLTGVAEPEEPKLFWDLEPEPEIDFNKHFLRSVLRVLG